MTKKLVREERLKGVNQILVDALRLTILNLDFDVLVVEGLRSVERQKELIQQGKSWIKDPSKGSHVLGNAVDLVPIDGLFCMWKDDKKFQILRDELLKYCDLKPVIVKDKNHFELEL